MTSPSDHDFSRAADILMIVRIACAAGGVVCLALILIFAFIGG